MIFSYFVHRYFLRQISWILCLATVCLQRVRCIEIFCMPTQTRFVSIAFTSKILMSWLLDYRDLLLKLSTLYSPKILLFFYFLILQIVFSNEFHQLWTRSTSCSFLGAKRHWKRKDIENLQTREKRGWICTGKTSRLLTSLLVEVVLSRLLYFVWCGWGCNDACYVQLIW